MSLCMQETHKSLTSSVPFPPCNIVSSHAAAVYKPPINLQQDGRLHISYKHKTSAAICSLLCLELKVVLEGSQAMELGDAISSIAIPLCNAGACLAQE